uniref:DMT(Drug/metabolite transporter) superfamily permease n=1 Tax=Desulfovibrio sp. U5L TaxID=596152 RepID=I2Q1L6_9BACT
MTASLAPALFVFLWSTGFVVARAIVPYADPCLFLTARFALAGLVLAGGAALARASWPSARQAAGHLAAGGLLHGLYLAASYRAVALGLSPGVMALFGALQPPLTALCGAWFFRERPDWRLGCGMAAGLAGVGVVVWPGLSSGGGGGLPPVSLTTVGLALAGVSAITIGALVQKSSLARADLRAAGALQHAGGAVVTALLAMVWDETRFLPSLPLFGALAWGVGGLSVGGASLLVWLVRQGEASRAVSLLFLAPPLAAAEAWLLFGVRLGPMQWAGFALALGGVVLARRLPAEREGPSVEDLGLFQGERPAAVSLEAGREGNRG